MNHKRSEKMFRLAEHVDREQQQACCRMAELRDALAQSERQLEALRGYMQSCADTTNGVTVPGGRLSSAAELINYSAFLGQINQAVRQQQAHVEHARDAFDMQTRRWKQARSRRLALTQVAERQAASERRRFELTEQNDADDLTLRRCLEPET